MGTVQALPKPDSYVIEWEALQIKGADDFPTLRRMAKNSPWAVQVVLEREDQVVFVFTTMHPTGVEQWTMTLNSWVVKSPHGRWWFMSESEFQSQFTWRAEG